MSPTTDARPDGTERYILQNQEITATPLRYSADRVKTYTSYKYPFTYAITYIRL